MRTILKRGLLGLGALALAGPVLAQADVDTTPNGRKLTATLTGGAEVPGPGDTNGGGVFDGRVNPGTGRLCYTLTVANLDEPTMAHIHAGKSGVAGDAVVTLDTPEDGRSEDCQDIDKALAQALVRDPSAYYVNVHTRVQPNGAIRGQLMR